MVEPRVPPRVGERPTWRVLVKAQAIALWSNPDSRRKSRQVGREPGHVGEQVIEDW